MSNKLLLLVVCITFGNCANNEFTINQLETTPAKIPQKRRTVFEKFREHSEEELAWKRENEIFQVFVYANKQIFVEGKLTSLKDLKSKGKSFYRNYWKVSSSPFADTALISLRKTKGTDYKFYLAVYDELRQIYSDLWEEEAQNTYKTSFDKLEMKYKKLVRKKIPLSITEAEPAEF